MTAPLVTVHDLAPDHVVVELHESLTAPFGGIELHLAIRGGRQRPVAWWLVEWGRLLRRVSVGKGCAYFAHREQPFRGIVNRAFTMVRFPQPGVAAE